MNDTRQRNLRPRGMSLIELLVAMSLGALLMMLLYSVLSSVQTGWHRSKALAASSSDELASAQFLFTTVSAALPPDPLDENTWFRGTSDQIEFLSAPPAAESWRGPVKIRLYSIPQELDRKALMMEMHASGEPPMSAHGARARIILSNIKTVSFEFSDLHDGRMQDTTSWNAPEKLPKLIKINIVFMSARANPVRLAIAPRRSISGRCNFDLVSLSCRV